MTETGVITELNFSFKRFPSMLVFFFFFFASMNFPKHKITCTPSTLTDSIESGSPRVEHQKKKRKRRRKKERRTTNRYTDNYLPEIISNKLNDQKNNSKQINIFEMQRIKMEQQHIVQRPHPHTSHTILQYLHI